MLLVAPVRERGLKYNTSLYSFHLECRSREGAWIEMYFNLPASPLSFVAPVRERGLKY